MSVVLRVLAVTGHAPIEQPAWLESFDIEAHDGLGVASWTEKPEEALQFADAGEALSAWRTQSTKRPLRGDGAANRPLTSLTIEIEPAP